MDRIEVLRLFARVVERGSFSAAARELKIKQSTASKWVAELEAQLGERLVERTTRSVRVTDAGRRVLARAGDVLEAFDALAAEFEARSPEPRGRVRMSAPVVFGRLFVVPALADFLVEHAGVSVELVMSDRYVNLVDEGFELAVRVGIPTDTGARARRLAESRRVVVAAPSYLRTHPAPKVPADLRGHDCLVHGESDAPTVWRFSAGEGRGAPVAVRGRFTANNSEAILMMARRGLGIALLADWLVRDELARGRLVPLLDGFEAPLAPVLALSPPGRAPSATVRALTDHLGAALKKSLG